MQTEAPQLTSETRFERKYRCTYAQYYAVKNALSSFIIPDPYTKKAPINKYLVRSLYFDSYDLPILLEKINGNASRVKFRLRTYGESAQENPDIRVEMKVRQANLTKKYGALIDLEACTHFLACRHWEKPSDPVLTEFERQVHARSLFPKILVEYRREGFFTHDIKPLRITFDHKMKSTTSRNLFPDQPKWQKHLGSIIVLEIKHQGELPRWLLNIVQSNQLRLVSNSKFALGMMSSRRDLIFQGWR